MCYTLEEFRRKFRQREEDPSCQSWVFFHQRVRYTGYSHWLQMTTYSLKCFVHKKIKVYMIQKQVKCSFQCQFLHINQYINSSSNWQKDFKDSKIFYLGTGSKPWIIRPFSDGLVWKPCQMWHVGYHQQHLKQAGPASTRAPWGRAWLSSLWVHRYKPQLPHVPLHPSLAAEHASKRWLIGLQTRWPGLQSSSSP